MDGESQEETISACERAARAQNAFPLIIGHHADGAKLLDLARELAGLNTLERKFPELRGDPIARREIDARITEVRQKLEDILHGLIDECRWFVADQKAQQLTKRLLNEQLSTLADAIFSDGTPYPQ